MSLFANQLEDLHVTALACMAVVIVVCAIRWYTDPLRAIPTVGGSPLPGLSYLTVRYAPPDFKEILKEGYRKYPDSAFKIAHHLNQWVVVVSGRRMVEELRKRPDDELSAHLGKREFLQSRYSFEAPLMSNRYHVQVMKEKLARTLPDIVPDALDEISLAVKEHIVATDHEWTSICVMPATQNIAARAISRAFVGLPLCRNPDYVAQAIDFTSCVAKDAGVFRAVPSVFKPFVSLFVHNVKNHTNLAVPHVRPVIEGMKASAESGGARNEKPNNMLQFLLDKAPENESLAVIVQRLLVLNFAAINTSANAAAHVLYRLAEDPKLLVPLREEIEQSIATDGWTITALNKMWKLDSILRETLRHHPANLLSMYRKAVKDITLCDGTRIPRGTVVTAAADAMHHDEAVLKNADTFDPFRYARMRSATDDGGLKYQFTSTSPEYIAWGYGLQACPGRYFASYELKATLAHIILEYDLKLGGSGVRPADVSFGYGMNAVPAPDGCVLFRKRGMSSPS
ncbi:hypothetical protein V8D89_005318 [Ganoderma adspersum]